ncbi:MAG: peptidoglycan-binding protein [Arthrobacter sp.]|jgi:peptidoglycan hydrolase-like protein with peptidoglycan-binding domain|nr:peptidoglycan-binding protein [Arthrobacter sp.]
MATAISQNGWSVIFTATDKNTTKIPHIVGRVRAGDVATIFTALVNFIHAHVEDVSKGADDWGGNVRPIRGKTTGYSNHASYTAIDINALQHPRGVEGTWTPAQASAIRQFLKDTLEGVVRFGEDYSRKLSLVDGMHFEINANAAAVARVAAKLRGEKAPSTTGKTPAKTPAITAATGSTTLLYQGNPKNSAARVRKLQAGLNRAFPAYSKFAGGGDGKFGPYAAQVVKEFQRRSGLKPDGVVGPTTIKGLRKHGINL